LGVHGPSGFDLLANFTHNFCKPYAVTVDFQDLQLSIAGRKPR
jgi:hypothetical protein